MDCVKLFGFVGKQWTELYLWLGFCQWFCPWSCRTYLFWMNKGVSVGFFFLMQIFTLNRVGCFHFVFFHENGGGYDKCLAASTPLLDFLLLTPTSSHQITFCQTFFSAFVFSAMPFSSVGNICIFLITCITVPFFPCFSISSSLMNLPSF